MEIDDEEARCIHGIFSSDSDTDSNCKSELDEEYDALKPPPIDYELMKDNIVLFPPKKTEDKTIGRKRKTRSKAMELKQKTSSSKPTCVQTELPKENDSINDNIVEEETEIVSDFLLVTTKRKKKAKSWNLLFGSTKFENEDVNRMKTSVCVATDSTMEPPEETVTKKSENDIESSKPPQIDNEPIEDIVIMKEESEAVDVVVAGTKKKKKAKSKLKTETSEQPKPAPKNKQEEGEAFLNGYSYVGPDYIAELPKKNRNKPSRDFGSKSFLEFARRCISDFDFHVLKNSLPDIRTQSLEKLIYINKMVKDGLQEMDDILELSQLEREAKQLSRHTENDSTPSSPKKKSRSRKKKKPNPTVEEAKTNRTVTEKQLNLTRLDKEIEKRAWPLPKNVEPQTEIETTTELGSEDLNNVDTASETTDKTRKKKKLKQNTVNRSSSSDSLEHNQKPAPKPTEVQREAPSTSNNEKLDTLVDDTQRNLTPIRHNSLENIKSVSKDQNLALVTRTSPRLLFDVNRRNFRRANRNTAPREIVETKASRAWDRRDRNNALATVNRDIHSLVRWESIDEPYKQFTRIFSRLMGPNFVTNTRQFQEGVICDGTNKIGCVSSGAIPNGANTGIVCRFKDSNDDLRPRPEPSGGKKEKQRLLLTSRLLQVSFLIFLAKLVAIVLKEIIAFLCRNIFCVCIVFSAFLTIKKFKSQKK